MGVSIVKRSTKYNLRREDKSLVFDEHVLGINKNGNYYIIHKRPNIDNLCDSEGNIIFPTDGKIEVVNAFIKCGSSVFNTKTNRIICDNAIMIDAMSGSSLNLITIYTQDDCMIMDGEGNVLIRGINRNKNFVVLNREVINDNTYIVLRCKHNNNSCVYKNGTLIIDKRKLNNDENIKLIEFNRNGCILITMQSGFRGINYLFDGDGNTIASHFCKGYLNTTIGKPTDFLNATFLLGQYTDITHKVFIYSLAENNFIIAPRDYVSYNVLSNDFYVLGKSNMAYVNGHDLLIKADGTILYNQHFNYIQHFKKDYFYLGCGNQVNILKPDGTLIFDKFLNERDCKIVNAPNYIYVKIKDRWNCINKSNGNLMFDQWIDNNKFKYYGGRVSFPLEVFMSFAKAK